MLSLTGHSFKCHWLHITALLLESWRSDPTDLHDPFTQPALDAKYKSEKWNYDQNLKLYKFLNQNFHSRMKVSKSEEQVQKLKAEATSQHREYSRLSAWRQERADQEVTEREHEQPQDLLDDVLA